MHLGRHGAFCFLLSPGPVHISREAKKENHSQLNFASLSSAYSVRWKVFCTVIFNSLNSPQRGYTIVLNLEGESERVNIITQVDDKTRFEPTASLSSTSLCYIFP